MIVGKMLACTTNLVRPGNHYTNLHSHSLIEELKIQKTALLVTRRKINIAIASEIGNF